MFCTILVPGEQFPQKALLYSLFSESARHSRHAKIRNCSEEPVYFSVLACHPVIKATLTFSVSIQF